MSHRIEGKIPTFSDPTALFAARDEIREQRSIPNPFIGKPYENPINTPDKKPLKPPAETNIPTNKFGLNQHQAQIFELYLQGIRPSEIAELLNRERTSILQSISYIRKKIGTPSNIPQQEAIRYAKCLEDDIKYTPSTELKPVNDKLRNILNLYLLGVSHVDIAKEIGLSKYTVEIYVSRLRKKFGIPAKQGKSQAIESIKQKLTEDPHFLG